MADIAQAWQDILILDGGGGNEAGSDTALRPSIWMEFCDCFGDCHCICNCGHDDDGKRAQSRKAVKCEAFGNESLKEKANYLQGYVTTFKIGENIVDEVVNWANI